MFSTIAVVAPEDGTEQAPPIGEPLLNVKAYVLDDQLQPVGVEMAGELYVGGEQLARGYLGQPGLTKEKFLADKFAGKPDARMYRTGDWARWLPNGELDFLGRRDDQIQIRGIRVELGEIEAAISPHEGVRQVCCVPLLDEDMPSGVSAHIVPVNNHPDFAGELRSYLEARLPARMIPSEFVMHERFPLTPQGKLDRRALMALRPVAKERPQPVTSGNDLEKTLFGLWQQLLPAAGDGELHATFQSLGGDSLLAIKLLLEVEATTGQKIQQSTFFLKPTFAGLCESVQKSRSTGKFEPVITLRKEGGRTPLICLYGVHGDINFSSDFVDALGGDQPVYGVRSPGLMDLSRLPRTMEEAAREAIGWIRQIQPSGVPALVGYSWGGLLGFEVARQLAQAEGISCFTALIGTGAPSLPSTLLSRTKHFASTLPAWLWNLAADRGNRRRRLARWNDMLRATQKTLTGVTQESSPAPILSPVARDLLELAKHYRPSPVRPLQIDLFREKGTYWNEPIHPLKPGNIFRLPDGGWSRWSGIAPRVHWLEGDHNSIIKPPQVTKLGREVRSAIEHHFNLAHSSR